MPDKKRIFFRNMAKIVHGASVALGLAVACIHALCGAEKSETRAGAYSGDAFLPGVLRTADACARPEDQRKNRVRERIARAQKSGGAAFLANRIFLRRAVSAHFRPARGFLRNRPRAD